MNSTRPPLRRPDATVDADFARHAAASRPEWRESPPIECGSAHYLNRPLRSLAEVLALRGKQP